MAMRMDSPSPSRGALGSFMWSAAGVSVLIHGSAILAAVTLFDRHPPVIIETVSVDIVFDAGSVPGGDPRPAGSRVAAAEAAAVPATPNDPPRTALSDEAVPPPPSPPASPPDAAEMPPSNLEPAAGPEPDPVPEAVARSIPDPLPAPVVAESPQPELVALRVPEMLPPARPPVEEKTRPVRHPVPVPPPLPKARMFELRPPVDVAASDTGTVPLPARPAGQAAGEAVEVASVAALSAIAPGAGASAPNPAFVAARYSAGSAGNVPPKYPHRARRLGYEGRVVLRVEVLPSGETGYVDIVAGSGHGILDRAAVKAVRRWRFLPATRAGVPVADTLDVPITFRLKD